MASMIGGGSSGGIDDSGLLAQILGLNVRRMQDMYQNLGLQGSTMEQQDISTSPNSLVQQNQALSGQLQPEIAQANLQQNAQNAQLLGQAGTDLGSIANLGGGAGLGL